MREHTYISSDIFLSDTFLRGFVHTGLGGRKHQCSLIHLALIVLLGTKSFRNILPLLSGYVIMIWRKIAIVRNKVKGGRRHRTPNT